MKNSLPTLACCVALVAALSPVFAPVLTAAVNAPALHGPDPVSRPGGELCSRHHADRHGADQGRHSATTPALQD